MDALAISGFTVYAGGSFSGLGGTTRNRLAAIGTDGTLTSWNPNVNDEVNTLAISGSTIYAGGTFSTVGSSTRNKLAAIRTNGTLTSWNPNVGTAFSTVYTLAISGSTVYAGGSFTTVSGNSNIIRFAQFIVPQRNGGRAALQRHHP